MMRFLLGVMLLGMHTTPLSALTFDRYHSQDEINFYLKATSLQVPDLVETKTLGQSRQGRDIIYAIIQPKDGKPRDAILINGTHHGNEKSSTESVLGLMKYLLAHRQEANVREILATYAIYVVPLVNPDGHAADSRTDSQGLDINRDYSYPLRKAEESFRTESSQLIRSLMEQVRFHAAIAYHSGMEAILWPACYTNSPPTDQALFRALSKKTAKAMGFTRYLQSYQDYPSEGEFIDFAYSTYGTLAITMEVSEEPSPSEKILPTIVDRSIRGALSFLDGLRDVALGRLDLDDENPSPFSQSKLQFAVDSLGRLPKAVHH
jgi:predicted deacylase